MARYVCDCVDVCREEYDDSIEVEAGNMIEAKGKALHEFCGSDWVCLEINYCDCKLTGG